MDKSRNIVLKESVGERTQNPVLVIRIKAPRRPCVSFTGCLMSHRLSDWHDFGVEVCNEEIERREAIHELMTDDEREFFNKY